MCACAHLKILGFIYICLLFALTCSVVSFCCSFLLGLITIFDLQHSLCSMLFFFSHKKEYPPTWQSIPSTHIPKNSVTKKKTILEFLLHTRHTIPIVVAIFWTYLSSFFLFCFWLLSLFLFFPSRFFLLREKRKFALSPLFRSRICSPQH